MHFFQTLNRQMPYHFQHSTRVLGIAPIFSGDDRIINNIVLCLNSNADRFASMQTCYTERCLYDSYLEKITKGDYGHGDPPALPVWMEDNVYTIQ